VEAAGPPVPVLEEQDADTLARMRERGVLLVPTLAV
jgi:hypothetical protein